MRPRGDVHMALLRAVEELATPERGATLRELAQHACVGLEAARLTLGNMRCAGYVVIARTRRVPYRNRPVAEYALPTAAPVEPCSQGMGALMAAWAAPSSSALKP